MSYKWNSFFSYDQNQLARRAYDVEQEAANVEDQWHIQQAGDHWEIVDQEGDVWEDGLVSQEAAQSVLNEMIEREKTFLQEKITSLNQEIEDLFNDPYTRSRP